MSSASSARARISASQRRAASRTACRAAQAQVWGKRRWKTSPLIMPVGLDQAGLRAPHPQAQRAKRGRTQRAHRSSYQAPRRGALPPAARVRRGRLVEQQHRGARGRHRRGPPRRRRLRARLVAEARPLAGVQARYVLRALLRQPRLSQAALQEAREHALAWLQQHPTREDATHVRRHRWRSQWGASTTTWGLLPPPNSLAQRVAPAVSIDQRTCLPPAESLAQRARAPAACSTAWRGCAMKWSMSSV